MIRISRDREVVIISNINTKKEEGEMKGIGVTEIGIINTVGIEVWIDERQIGI